MASASATNDPVGSIIADADAINSFDLFSVSLRDTAKFSGTLTRLKGPSGFSVLFWPLYSGSRTSAFLDVEVHTELKRVRAHSEGLNLALALVSYPAINQLRREHVAFQEEAVVCLKRLQRFIQ